MKTKVNDLKCPTLREERRSRPFLSSGLAALACLPLLTAAPAHAHDHDHDHGRDCDRDGRARETHYQPINLVSDISNVATLQDTNLVNAWGLAFGPSGPFWVGDNGTGKATLYAVTNDASGAPHITRNARVVTIPGNGGVTGQVFNSTTNAFNGNAFVFVSTDGTLSGWRPALGNAAEVLATRPSALYAGATLVASQGAPVLLAANFSEGTIDKYDSELHLLDRLADHHAPVGYAPFNVQTVAGAVFVTFAKQDVVTHGVARGSGLGFIDVLDVARGTFHRFATGKGAGGNVREMDAPWGIALAPAGFGSHAGHLLVGNFGSGTIMAFGLNGAFRGLLRGSAECPVTIDGLWLYWRCRSCWSPHRPLLHRRPE
ncbi:MAG: TIGR03118 family protein [Verrucomicrobiota bacterium]